MPANTSRKAIVQPAWIRIMHWLNALAVLLLIFSGWRIYNASPIFSFRFGRDYVLGGWLGGALLWHFAAMWVLFLNGVLYLSWNLYSGRMRARFFPLGPKSVLADFAAALRGHLSHDDPNRYNAVQKAAYLGAMALIALAIVSGLAIWKPVQFPVLRDLLGGFDNARIVHFFVMAGISAFVVVHLVMVALVPKTLRLMILGR